MKGSLRKILPRSYGAFLGRFERPTPIQSEAIPAILEGHDVLLCAPTASGKTEAYGAPCAELLMAEADKDAPELPRWLLVSPTRALANDLTRRLEAGMNNVGLGLGRYTGEHKERSKNRWPQALVVTPESLDSLLARRPHVLAQVRRVVVDEIHVLDNSVRGDQLRILLHRLDQAAENKVQRIAASATVDHAKELANRYLQNPKICVAEGDRKVKARSFAGTSKKAVAAHLKILAKAGLRKILIFVPSRRDVDELSLGLTGQAPFGDRIYAHHGSLSQAVRERTERQFHDAPAAVAVATTTLELGIDIGSVDYVLLSSPPASVPSLMQRIGRGGRRGGFIRFGYAWRDSGEELRFKVMAKAGIRGEYLETPYGFRASVLVQQAVSLAGGQGYVNVERLHGILPPALAEMIESQELAALLHTMVERDWLEPGRSGRYVLTEGIEERYERGTLHSNLADTASVDLVDRLTGDVVGQLAGGGGARPGRMAIGGTGRKVIRDDGNRILTDASGTGQGVRYAAKGSPLTSFSLGRAIAEELGAEPNGMLVVRGEGSLRVIHGLGSLGGIMLAALLGEQGMLLPGSPPTAISLALPAHPEPWSNPGADFLREFLRRHKARLVRLAAMGPHHSMLPDSLAEPALEEASGLMQVADFFEKAHWQGPVDLADLDPALLHL